MTNEELVILIQQGQTERLHDLWSQVERLGRYWANQYARTLITSGIVYDERDAFDDLFNGCCYPAMCEAVKLYDQDKGNFVQLLSYCFKNEAAKLYGIKTTKRDAALFATSLNQPLGEGAEDLELEDLIPDPADPYEDPEHRIYLEQLHETMEAALNNLSEAQADVLRKRYHGGYSQKQIGDSLGVTQQHIFNLERKAFRMIRRGKYANQLRAFLYPADYYSEGLRGSSISAFRRTGSSATERAALRVIDKEEECERLKKGRIW